jgi:hypothetical protein
VFWLSRLLDRNAVVSQTYYRYILVTIVIISEHLWVMGQEHHQHITHVTRRAQNGLPAPRYTLI